MYDFAHCLSDAIEGITHSLCTLEFADHRPLYEWVLDALGIKRPRPEQTEFARGNLSHTVVSKRVLRRLVEEEPRARLGRPAHADARRACAAGLPARRDPRASGRTSASRGATT